MSERLYVATRKGLFALERSQGNWRIVAQSFIGDPVSMLLHDRRDGALFAALNLGHFGVKLHRSRDDGATWEEISVPKYPEKPAQDEGEDGQKDVPWSLEMIWALEAGGPDQPGTLWAGTLPGGLFRSDDSGETWQLNRPLWDHPDRRKWFGGGYDQPGIHTVLVDPRDSSRIILGVSCGGIWESLDQGGSWRTCCKGIFAEYVPPDRREDPSLQDPHRIAWCRCQPDQLWVQHHNGVFRSQDGCNQWSHVEGIQPSSFGFAVEAHPENPDMAWLAPAVKDECRVPVDGRFVVTRTSDGGRTFEALDKGLPPAPSFDLVYRHCLEIDPAGRFLAMGSTTGALWISEDLGESWDCVSTHLPPIYATRWR